jgi:MerR family transcriptional regulator, mercuric resistance operon regulatory protein
MRSVCCMPALATITAGVLAEKSGTDIDVIRSYQRLGLLPRPSRVGGGLLLYRREDIDRVLFVRRALSLGFSHDAVRELLALVDDKRSKKCGDVYAIVRRHLEDVRSRIADLVRMEQALAPLVDDCRPETSVAECPVLRALAARPGDRSLT